MPRRADRRAAPAGLTRVSLERRRALAWLALPAAQLVVPPLFANVARRAAARVWPAHEYTRLIVETPVALPHQLIALKQPERLALDIAGLELTPEVARLATLVQPADPYIAQVRFGRVTAASLRIVLDLKTEVSPQVFQLPPVAEFGYRLVVDLYPATPVDPVMALLEGSRPAEAPAKGGEAPRPPSGGAPRRITVALDPGHGGEDPGAIGRRGTHEKQVALAVARKLKAQLDGEPNLRAMLTRDDDYYVPLDSRVQRARRAQADLFVSIHADAFRDPAARGSSVYALSDRGATSAAAKWLAQRENAADLIGGVNLEGREPALARTLLELSQAAQISDSLKAGRHVLKEIGEVNALHKNAVEQAGFAVLKAPDIPSILVETAFISNPDEELRLRSEKHQQKLAESMADGIKRYFAGNPPLARG